MSRLYMDRVPSPYSRSQHRNVWIKEMTKLTTEEEGREEMEREEERKDKIVSLQMIPAMFG